jgi:proline iminopeptidase
MRPNVQRAWSLALALLTLAAPLSAQPRTTAVGDGAMATEPHDVIINGVRFWYRVAGQPRMAWRRSCSRTVALATTATASRRIVYNDQRGAGRSERPWNNEYTLALLVDVVEALRLTLGVPQIWLIGHSFGGALGLEYAAKCPSRVALPDARIVVYDRGGHSLYLDDPAQFVHDVVPFLAGRTSAGR